MEIGQCCQNKTRAGQEKQILFRSYCNREMETSIQNGAQFQINRDTSGDLQPRSRVGSVVGNSLRGDIRGKGILAKRLDKILAKTG